LYNCATIRAYQFTLNNEATRLPDTDAVVMTPKYLFPMKQSGKIELFCIVAVIFRPLRLLFSIFQITAKF